MIHHSTWNFRHFHMRSLQVSSKRQQGHQSSCHNYTNHRSKGRRKCNRSRHRGKSLGYNRTLVVRSRNLLIRHRYTTIVMDVNWLRLTQITRNRTAPLHRFTETLIFAVILSRVFTGSNSVPTRLSLQTMVIIDTV